MENGLKLLKEKGFINEEDLNQVTSDYKEKNGLFHIEKQTQDDVLHLYYFSLERFDIEASSKDIETIKDNIISMGKLFKEESESKNIYCCGLFEKWEQERNVLKKILSYCRNAQERKAINDIFNFKTSVYISNNEIIPLKVDQDGINYLEYTTVRKEDESSIEAQIYNISMRELQSLYNLTGPSLFKLNVRIGIQNKKAGTLLKEEFKNYLKVGIINSSALKENKGEMKSYFSLSDSQIEQYRPELFWYKHNGINIFIEEESDFEIETDYIKLNPEKVSVINGAQTLNNMFLAGEELLEDLERYNSEVSYDFKKIINEIMGSIFVKTVFIKGDDSLSKTITWGLNNQIPIQKEDFIGASNVVQRLNELLSKNQMKILKTGEIGDVYKGFSPLEFIKLFLIADGHPGKSKNFDKSKLENELKNVLGKIENDDKTIDKITVAIEVERWWKNFIKETSEKTLFVRYGKNYFQSYVIHILMKSSSRGLNTFMSNDLEVYFADLEKYIASLNIEVNDFKKDEKFASIIAKYDESEHKGNQVNFKEYQKELVEYVKKNKENNYSISNIINKFNHKKNIVIDYFRTISYIKGRIKENFPLPNSTFTEFYKREGYMENDDYPKFSESLFLKEINRKYPVYIIFLDDNNRIENIKLIEEFSLTNGPNWEKDAKETFNLVRKAFIQGDVSLLPKVSKGISFHIRPKAIDGEDTFQFTDGKDITKRTFWANANFIGEILERDNNLHSR